MPSKRCSRPVFRYENQNESRRKINEFEGERNESELVSVVDTENLGHISIKDGIDFD